MSVRSMVAQTICAGLCKSSFKGGLRASCVCLTSHTGIGAAQTTHQEQMHRQINLFLMMPEKIVSHMSNSAKVFIKSNGHKFYINCWLEFHILKWAASMLGLSCPSSAPVHTLILLRVSEERMVLATSWPRFSDFLLTLLPHFPSQSLTLSIAPSLEIVCTGSKIREHECWQEPSQSFENSGSYPTAPNRKPSAFMAEKWTGKDKVNPYHFPS